MEHKLDTMFVLQVIFFFSLLIIKLIDAYNFQKIRIEIDELRRDVLKGISK